MNLERNDIIDSILDGSPNRLRENYFKKNNNIVYESIMEYTSGLDLSFKQRVWHWVNMQNNYIFCIECGENRVSFNMNWRDGYKKFCSNKCSSNNKELRESTKETLLNKYGVDHYSKTSEYVDKVKITSLSKYGVDNYSKTKDYVNKSKKTYSERYGVDSYTKTTEYIEKSKKTYIKRYGVDHYTKTDEYKEKFKKTCLNRYGENHIYKTSLYRLNFNIGKDINYIGYVDGLNKFKCEHGHLFEISTDNYYGRVKNKIPLCTICNPIGDSSSIKESELLDYIKSIYNGDIIHNYRDGVEIDIYLPSLKIGFEFNGVYWHSDKFKQKDYHLSKTNYFRDRGIRIIHIWEDDWIFKNDIIKSQIKNWIINNSNKIFARKCEIRELSNTSKFLNENHIQGVDRSTKKIGLFYDNRLVSVMTFNQLEGRNKMNIDEWNLSRFCNKLNTSVVGGASKLLNYFIKVYKPSRIISYADKDWSVGDLYYKLGFSNINESSPDYKYVVGGVRRHKQNFTKTKLKISNDLTESEYMYDKNIYKIWDCGKIKFEIYLK